MEQADGGGSAWPHSSMVVAALVFVLGSCGREPMPERRPATAQPAAAAAQPAPDGARATASVESEDGQWTRPAKSFSSLRYSGLDQINTTNVAKLQPA